jgi:hypothetical protein
MDRHRVWYSASTVRRCCDETDGTVTIIAGWGVRIEALGGRITVTSPRGAGTSIRGELPVSTSRGQ